MKQCLILHFPNRVLEEKEAYPPRNFFVQSLYSASRVAFAMNSGDGTPFRSLGLTPSRRAFKVSWTAWAAAMIG